MPQCTSRLSVRRPFDELQKVYGEPAVLAFRAAVGEDPHNLRERSLTAFLSWLADRAEEDLEGLHAKVIASIAGGTRAFKSPTEFSRAIADVLAAWRVALLEEGELATTTLSTQVGQAAMLIEQASLLPDSPIPQWKRRKWVRNERSERGTTRPSLGVSNWPELMGLPEAARERKAMQMVRSAFVEIFLAEKRLFDAGASILSGDPADPGVDPEARERFRVALTIIKDALEKTGQFKLPNIEALNTAWHKSVAQPVWVSEFMNPEFWRKAGLEPKDGCHWRGDTFLSCVAPSAAAAMSALGIVCCDTGWNLQPLSTIPQNPFVYRTARSTALASAAFISSYKKRAGHDVAAYLEDTPRLKGGMADKAIASWKSTVDNFDPNHRGDGYAVLQESRGDDISSLTVIENYRRMTSIYRRRSSINELWLFKIYLNSDVRTLSRSRSSVSESFADHPILGRPEVTWSAIRKTFLLLKSKEVSSVSSVRANAGHAKTGVLMRHYLNTPAVTAELDRSIRDYQDCLEAVIVKDLDRDKVAVSLLLEPAELERLRAVAASAGISMTFSIGVTDEGHEPERPLLTFTTSNDNLQELYLLHKKLFQMESSYQNKGRWRSHYIPLFAVTKAIGLELLRNGMFKHYYKSAKRACAQLRSGDIALPCLED